MDYNKKVSINDKIKQIKNKEILNKIFNLCLPELIINGKHKYTKKTSGIYFNMKYISDETLINVEKVIDNFLKNTETDSDNLSFIKYSVENKVEKYNGDNNGPRLNNFEKNIMMN